MSIHSRFSRFCDDYLSSTRGIRTEHHTTEEDGSVDKNTPAFKRALIQTGESLWQDVLAAGLFSRNEALEEYATSALELLWIPFLVSDLYQQYHGEWPTATTSTSEPSSLSSPATATTPMVDNSDHRMRSSPSVPGRGGMLSTAESVRVSMGRQRSLSKSRAWFKRYLELMEDLELFTAEMREKCFPGGFEDDDEKRRDPQAAVKAAVSASAGPSRQLRIELSRTRSALEKTWKESEDRVGYLYTKQRRMRALRGTTTTTGADSDPDEEPTNSISNYTTNNNNNNNNNNNINHSRASKQEQQDDEDKEAADQGGEEEDGEVAEARRERALARLRWACYDGCYQQEMSQRELLMLEALDPNARAVIAQHYQETLDAVRRGEKNLGRQTYTILPNGQMIAGTLDHPMPLSSDTVQRGGGGGSVPAFAPSGVVFAQQVRNELMIDRNPPTQTLQEFAEGEIAMAMQQQEAERAAREAQAEEDERLGPEGIEERDRVKAAKWDDWKDDNPRYGKSSKGNYS